MIAERSGPTPRVAAVSAEAETLGVRVGEALAAVRARVPGLHVAELEAEADARALARLGHWALRRYSPLVALDPPDGLLLEAHGASHLWGGEARMAADLACRLEVAGIAARIAIAPSATAARALARHGPAPITIIAAPDLPTALAPLPPAALGITPEEGAELARLGLATLGDLAALPRTALGRRFGLDLLRRLDAAFARTAEPLDWLEPPPALSAEVAFPDPVAEPEALHAAVRQLAAQLAGQLTEAGLGARRLDLRVTRIDGSRAALRAGTSAPSRDPAHLARLLALLVESLEPGAGVEKVALSAPLTAPLPPRQLGAEDRHALEAAIDRLSTRLGERAVWQAGPTLSDRPEASFARHPAGAGPAAFPWPRRLPRPVHLFDPPEPVEVIALLPDRPPVVFTWRGRRHRVRAADGPERIFGEWWRGDGEVRDYFQVEDTDGGRFWLFRSGDGEDPATGDFRWWLHGLFGA